MTQNVPTPETSAPARKGAGALQESAIPGWIADSIMALGLAALGLWFVVQAWPMPAGRTLIGVGTFPIVVGGLLVALCLGLVVWSLIQRHRTVNVVITRPVMVVIAMLLVLLFPTAMARFGYFPTALIWVPAFAWIAGLREVASIALITAVVLGLAYFLFQSLLGTPLT